MPEQTTDPKIDILGRYSLSKRGQAAKRPVDLQGNPSIEATANPPGDRITEIMRLIEQAQSLGNWDCALQHWRTLAELLPASDIGAVGAATALRVLGRRAESDAILAQAAQRFPQSEGVAASLALNAQDSGDWIEALDRWNNVRAQFPKNAYAHAASAAILLALGRADEGDALLANASVIFPDDASISFNFLIAAVARGDLAAVIPRWIKLESHFDRHPTLRSEALSALIGDRPDKDPIAQAMEAAEKRNDWSEAIRLGRRLPAHEPPSLSVLLGLSRALCRSGQLDEAEVVLSTVYRFFPGDLQAAVAWAIMAHSRRDSVEAERRWTSILERFDDVDAIIERAALAFRESRRFDESDRLFRRAIERWPDRMALRLNYAFNAEANDNWPEAARRWDAAHRLWPHDEGIRNARGTAMWHANLASVTVEGSTSGSNMAPLESRRPEPMPEIADDLRALALSFEGLGDDCEFGVVQRRSGAEPIGLFRFAGAGGVGNVTYLLENGLKTLGDPEFTRLAELGNGEYAIQDTRGYYLMHTFVRVGAVKADVFLQQQLRRIEFLKRKLIEDLTAGEKIFVYKSTFAQLTKEEAVNLHEALLRYGPNVLLGVSLEGDGRRAGAIEQLREGLMLGYLDKMIHSDRAQGLSLSVWHDLLREARAVARGLPHASTAAEPR